MTDIIQKRLDFQSDVRMALAGTLIDVELEEPEIEFAFRRAKKFYAQYGSNDFRRCFYKLDIERGKTVYDIPESINTTIKIIKPSRGLSLDDDMSQVIYQELFGGRSVDGDWLSYEMLLHKVERNQKYFAYEEQMIHDEFNSTLTILSQPRADGIWFLECYKNLEDHEYMEVDWIFRWTVAECKILLGQAYRKFSSLAAPTGEVSLDGNTLVQEGKDEMREMREELENGGDGSGSAGYMFITAG
jgi:hypothetical protein